MPRRSSSRSREKILSRRSRSSSSSTSRTRSSSRRRTRSPSRRRSRSRSGGRRRSRSVSRRRSRSSSDTRRSSSESRRTSRSSSGKRSKRRSRSDSRRRSRSSSKRRSRSSSRRRSRSRRRTRSSSRDRYRRKDYRRSRSGSSSVSKRPAPEKARTKKKTVLVKNQYMDRPLSPFRSSSSSPDNTLENPRFIMKGPTLNVLDGQINQAVLDDIDADSFAPRAFTSAKKIPDKVFIDLQNETIKMSCVDQKELKESIFHPNFLGDPVLKMEKWTRKLYNYRQRHCSSS